MPLGYTRGMKFFSRRVKNQASFTLDELQNALAGATADGFASISPKIARKVPGFYACLRILAGSMASTTWTVAGAPRRDQLDYLLNVSPHPRWTGAQLKEHVMIQVIERGNAYIRVIRDGASRIVGFQPLDASKVKVLEVKNNGLSYQQLDGGAVIPGVDVLHFTNLGFNGTQAPSSIGMAGGTAARALASSQSFLATLMQRGALQSVVVTIDKDAKINLNDSQMEDFRKRWEKTYGGTKNAAKPIVMAPGLSVEKLNLTPESMQFKELTEFQVSEVGRAFGIPSALLNLESKNSSLASGVSELVAGFLRFSLGPIINRFESELSKKLGYTAQLDTHQLTRLTPKDRYEQYKTAIEAGFLTANEVREMEGLEPFDSGASPGGNTE